jgi:hypothetical protein
MQAMSDKPVVHYWHLWADTNGVSHQTQCVLDSFDLKPIQSGAAPQWQGGKTTGKMATMVTVLPVGWIGTWHKNPKPQWIIPLSGRWFVESMDGDRVEMGAGEFSFGADQSCKPADGKCGHQSGTVGDTPAVLMIVQLDDAPVRTSPCTFR